MALHGEGSIFFDKSNDRWVWQWSYELPNGEKATKKIVAKKKADLRKKAEVFKFTVQQGIEQDANVALRLECVDRNLLTLNRIYHHDGVALRLECVDRNIPIRGFSSHNALSHSVWSAWIEILQCCC